MKTNTLILNIIVWFNLLNRNNNDKRKNFHIRMRFDDWLWDEELTSNEE